MFFFFPPPFRRNNLRSDLVRSAFHLPGKQAKQNHTERMLVRMTFPFVCRSGGNGLEGKAENIGKAHGKYCAQTVCYYRRNCDGMESGCWHIYLSQHVD